MPRSCYELRTNQLGFPLASPDLPISRSDQPEPAPCQALQLALYLGGSRRGERVVAILWVAISIHAGHSGSIVGADEGAEPWEPGS